MAKHILLSCNLLLATVVLVYTDENYWGYKYTKSVFKCVPEPLTLQCESSEVVKGQIFGGAFNDTHECSSEDSKTSPKEGDCRLEMFLVVDVSNDCFWKLSKCEYKDYNTMAPKNDCGAMNVHFLFAKYDCIARSHIYNICNKSNSILYADPSEQYITSPGFPKAYPVPAPDCTIQVIAGAGHGIQLYIRPDETKLPPLRPCSDAHITIYQNSTHDPSDTICKEFGPKLYKVPNITIIFNSGQEAKHYEGFVIRFWKVKLSTEVTTSTSTITTHTSPTPSDEPSDKMTLIWICITLACVCVLLLVIIITIVCVCKCRARASQGALSTTSQNDCYENMDHSGSISHSGRDSPTGYQSLVVKSGKSSGSFV